MEAKSIRKIDAYEKSIKNAAIYCRVSSGKASRGSPAATLFKQRLGRPGNPRSTVLKGKRNRRIHELILLCYENRPSYFVSP